VELLDAEIPLHPDTPPALQTAMRVMERAVQAATYMVYGIGQTQPEHQGMGTTVSALLVRGHYAVVAQVGDSRIYRIRGWDVVQLTEDHTLVEWQLKKGIITPEEAKTSRQRNVITRAVGSKEYVQVDTRLLPVQPGDGFLLCSDGLHGYVQPNELPALLTLGTEAATQRAVELANERGGKDNITAVFVVVR
jgi:protein phosphatase